MWNVKSKLIPLIAGATNWNHIKIIQVIPEQHSQKARRQGTRENSHTGHCTRIAESNSVKLPHVLK
jgi:hypothetical protein